MPGLPSHGETPVSVADASVLDLLAMVDWFDLPDHPGHSRHQDPDWVGQGMTAAEWNAAGRPGWVTNNPAVGC